MKTTIDFMKDLEEVQNLLVRFNEEADSYYLLMEKGEKNPEHQKEVDSFLSELSLPHDDESRLAAITRLVALRDDSLVQLLKKHGRNDSEIERSKELAYQWVSSWYNERQENLVASIEEQDLLTPFHRTALKGWHRIGLLMTKWQPDWTKTIINTVNPRLSEQFDGDDDAVNEYLHRNGLIDKGHGGEAGDRAYSVLLERAPQEWESRSYFDVFNGHVTSVVSELRNLGLELSTLLEPVFHEKQAWLDYIESLALAFEETNNDQLIERWADVDRKWMGISCPIQPSHPLEYYEDHYRKAVALEWDVRIANPEHATKGRRKEKVKRMSRDFFRKTGVKNDDYQRIVDFAVQKLDSVQLHIGRVGLFYGADYQGLPSAQVVPNDEVVSREFGKKIFAFPDNILQTLRCRPFVRLSREVFGQELLTESRKLMFQDRELWFKIYDITTIGHEYGHILWVDEDTEARMNEKGNYKNVEEWKATVGGLVSFFMDEDGDESGWDLKRHVIMDTVKRSVGLVAWRETGEVLPYYLEGLIHLKGMFESGMLKFDAIAGKLHIDISETTYVAVRDWYFKTYEDLAVNFYLAKKDPTPFLRRYAVKKGKIFVPADETIHAMTEWYWDMYQKYGREIDTEDSRENYLK